MKAVVAAGDGRVRVGNVPRPRIQDERDAVVAVRRTAICGSDVHLLDGKTPGIRIGGVIGHEFVGVVAEAGPGVGHDEGARVLGSFLIACGRCAACRSHRFNHCLNRRALGLGALTGDLEGAQAELVRVPEAHLNLLPLTGTHAGLTDEQALFGGDILATAFYAAHLADVTAGNLVTVMGAGPVGLLCALAARRLGASVTVLDTNPTRAAFARDRFALQAIEVSGNDPEAAVLAADGRLADAVIEAVGSVAALKASLRCVVDGGRVVAIGVYGPERYDLPLGRVWVRALTIRFAGMANVHAHWKEALGAVLAEEVDPTALVSHRLSLDDAETGYELFRSGEALKVVLTP